MNKIYIILYTFVFIGFSLGQIARIDFGNNTAISLLDIAVTLLTLYWIYNCIKNKSYTAIKNSVLFKPFLFFIGVAFVSIAIQLTQLPFNQFLPSFLYFLRFLLYGLLIFITASLDIKESKQLLSFFVYSSIFIVFLGFLQYFFYPNLRNLYYLGWDEHMYRMFSVFLDPNFAGCIFVISFMVFMYKYFQEKRREKKLLYSIFLSLTFLAIILTFSRTALVMLMVSCGSFLIITKKYKIVFAFGVLLIVFISIFSNPLVENKNILRIASTQARLESWENAFTIGVDNPLLGVGFNTYRYAQSNYGYRSLETPFINHADAGVDNSYLFVFATTGIVGIVSYFYFWIYVIRYQFKYRNKLFLSIMFSVTLGLLMSGIFTNTLFYTYIMSWMFILIGLGIKENI